MPRNATFILLELVPVILVFACISNFATLLHTHWHSASSFTMWTECSHSAIDADPTHSNAIVIFLARNASQLSFFQIYSGLLTIFARVDAWDVQNWVLQRFAVITILIFHVVEKDYFQLYEIKMLRRYLPFRYRPWSSHFVKSQYEGHLFEYSNCLCSSRSRESFDFDPPLNSSARVNLNERRQVQNIADSKDKFYFFLNGLFIIKFNKFDKA